MNRWAKILKHRKPMLAWFQRTYGKQHHADFSKKSRQRNRNSQHFVKTVAARRARNKVARRSRARNHLRR